MQILLEIKKKDPAFCELDNNLQFKVYHIIWLYNNLQLDNNLQFKVYHTLCNLTWYTRMRSVELIVPAPGLPLYQTVTVLFLMLLE